MRRFFLVLLALLSLLLVTGCPPDRGGSGDDDDASDDDDSGPEDDDDASTDDDDASDDDDVVDDDDFVDDDDAVGPCDPVDVTTYVGTGPYNGSNTGQNDDYTGSCSAGAVPDQLLVFTPATGGSYELSTDNAGTDFDTLIYAFTDCGNPGGSELGCNDDGAQEVFQYSSDLSISVSAGVPVYVAVEGYDGTGNYALTITGTICGDAVVSGDELCDDGNTDSGDGCDDLCQWECDEDTYEPNSTIADATDVDAIGLPATLEPLLLCPTDMNVEYGIFTDIFAVSVEADDNLIVQALPGATTACLDQEMIIQAYDVGLTEVLAEATPGTDDCLTLVAGPGPQDFLVFVWGQDQTLAPVDYGLSFDAAPPECGNGVTEPGEGCDDGNLVDGDGCEADCQLPPICGMTANQDLGVLTGTQNVSVDLSLETDDLPDVEGCADIGVGGGDYMIRFEVTDTGDLGIDLDHNGGGDAQYALFQADPDCDAVEIGTYGLCVDIYPDVVMSLTAAVTPGEYFLLIDAYSDTLTGAVEVDLTAP